MMCWRWRLFDGVSAALSILAALYWVNPFQNGAMALPNAWWADSWWITAGLCTVSVWTNGTGRMVSRLRAVVPALLLGTSLRG